MKSRKIKILLRLIVAILLALVIAIIAVTFYFINYALEPEKRSHAQAMERFHKREPAALKTWVDSLKSNNALRDTSITIEDRGKMCALFINAKQPSNKVAMLLHGYNDRAESMLHIAYIYYHELGYNVILPHFYAHGNSDGDHINMGWFDRLDMLHWIDVANNLFSGDSTATQMVIHGISMGGFTAMCISGEKCPPCVKCFVEDCGYTSVWDEFSIELHNEFSLPDFPLMHLTSLLCKLRYGWTFGEASAIKQLKKSTLPMLFVHGDADTFVPYSMLQQLYNAKQHGYKEKYIAHGSEHARAYTDHTEEYTNRVKNFVNKFII